MCKEGKKEERKKKKRVKGSTVSDLLSYNANKHTNSTPSNPINTAQKPKPSKFHLVFALLIEDSSL